MKHPRKKGPSVQAILLVCTISTCLCLFLAFRSVEPELPTETIENPFRFGTIREPETDQQISPRQQQSSSCATVEKMGETFAEGSGAESLRVRKIIEDHFALHGAPRVRGLPSDQFCRQGFVIGKASEAGFGNEMYKILTASALSVLLNRSLIIGQTRGKYPFGEYISYTNLSFTLREVKHLWRQNDCEGKYGRHLIMRTDDFEKASETNVLCSDWRKWKQPIIWFQGTTDAVAAQFFLKNVHPGMRNVASLLFGDPGALQSRPNVFGELMRVVVSPSQVVEEAVNQVLNGSAGPDVALHMRMRMNRSIRAIRAALNCIKKALHSYQQNDARPQVVLVSDTPSLIRDITPNLTEFAEVIHFDYKRFKGNLSSGSTNAVPHQSLRWTGDDFIHEDGMIIVEYRGDETWDRHDASLNFRVKDWGPAPRWVAFVDFFLASRAKHAVVSGAHRRVGTTYAQLIAALAAAHRLGEDSSTDSRFSFLSSFQSNLLVDGLGNQIGWGHVWNRFAGPLSCRHQAHQCAFTPLLPPAWWDGIWQSPISRDVRRLQAYGIHLTDSGEVVGTHLDSFCRAKKDIVKIAPVYRH
ncbi:uncharacterized protein LOC131246692 [Magnolia sinica]|uniref:uncharacterized protein LOC131246692 n=1 Tax=Magnolia sinica TaxID=86752 RepID=UPI002659AA90|nr:uncharacterized protein LOC131246692 [Magnolia sinica]